MSFLQAEYPKWVGAGGGVCGRVFRVRCVLETSKHSVQNMKLKNLEFLGGGGLKCNLWVTFLIKKICAHCALEFPVKCSRSLQSDVFITLCKCISVCCRVVLRVELKTK